MSREAKLKLRLTLAGPPAGVLFSLQDRDNTPVTAVLATGDDLSLDLAIRVAEDAKGLRFLGPFARGKAGDKFVYYASGLQAGQSPSPWSRRGKVKLQSLDPALVHEAVRSGGRIEIVLPGLAKDGGPSCATVKPLQGWRIIAD